MTSLHDNTGKDYLYVAAKENGLIVYDISASSPNQVSDVKISSLENLEVMNLSQDGNYLYLALGNHFGTAKQQSGMAVINVSIPSSPIVEDVWKYPSGNTGAGIVITSGNYAYLGAMQQGLVILDISNKQNIQFVSDLKPTLSFPVSNPDTPKYNVRGIAVKDNYLYTCFDAGGLRIIDVSNKSAPKEISKYSNTLLNNRPRAYNNVVLNYPFAYVTTDYCGLEILDISDTANIIRKGWWNPWRCDSLSNTWFNSPGHTNEIAYDQGCELVFMSSGKSELSIVNVSDPVNPVLCDSFGSVNSQQGTWGVSVYKNNIYLSYIFVPLGIPFYSNWSGIRNIRWNNNCTTNVNTVSQIVPDIYPNPNNGSFRLKLNDNSNVLVSIKDISGRTVYETTTTNNKTINTKLTAGHYIIIIQTNDRNYFKQIVIY